VLLRHLLLHIWFLSGGFTLRRSPHLRSTVGELSLALIGNVSARERLDEAVVLIAETFSIRRQEGSRWRFAADAGQLWDLNGVFLDSRTLKVCFCA
jgi:hypothetical protein